MKKTYKIVQCKVLFFNEQDVLTTSGFEGVDHEFEGPVPFDNSVFTEGK